MTNTFINYSFTLKYAGCRKAYTILEFLDTKDKILKENLMKRKTDIAYLTDFFTKFNMVNLQLQSPSYQCFLPEEQKQKNKNTNKKKIYQSETSEDQSDYMSVRSEEEGSSDDKGNELFEIPDSFGPVDSRPKEDDFILVQFNFGTRKIFYVAKMIGEGSKSEVELTMNAYAAKR
ncbi:unnamed protein product [Acanthoscelides obtectus]|uniref:Uncharacterized protein n=1 Tax=Acanthoscelides obtectus TaxID=200917 RepID=A0A9P0P3Y6_ACAOB|nr:unnamed protein product [Acanthoscelides obtectus]CAK1628444.1 hypothetical protein AOBTE_LOCUS5217 [Acanthoscelides obtectus]